MLFAVSVTVNSTLTPSRFRLPGTTMPPMRKVRPCGASLAATCEGVKKNTKFFWKAASTSAAAMPSAATPTAIAVMRLCLGFTAFSTTVYRSEERRVGKECGFGWGRVDEKYKECNE